MKYIQIIFFVLISFAVNAQQTFNPTLTGKAEAVGFGIGDTIGQVINFSDQSNFGFTLNQLEKNAIILDQAGTFWKIDSIFYKNALSSQIGISKIQGSSLYLYGDIAIMNLNSNGLITPATTNVTGITPKQQAEILNYVFNNITSSGSGEVSWSDILGIPEGFADGIDNTAEAGSGDGYAISGSYNTAAKTIDIVMADPAISFSIAVDSLLEVNRYNIETFTYASLGTPLSSELINSYFADNDELRINIHVIDNNASTVVVNLPDAGLYPDKKLFIFGHNKTATGKIEVNGIHDQPVDYELKDQQVIYLQSSEITFGTYQDYTWLLINSGTSSEAVVETDPVWIADSVNYATKIYADQYDDSGLTLQNVTDNDNVTTNEITVIDTVNGTKVIVQPSGIIQQYLTSAYGNEVFNFGDRWRGYNANYWRAAGTPSSPSHVLDQYVLGTRNWWGWNQAVNNYLTVFQEYVKTTGEYTTAYNTPGVYQLNSNNNNNWITGFQLSTTGQAYFPNLADGSSFDQFLKRNSADGEIGFGTLSWNSLQDIPADIADGDNDTQNTVNTSVDYIPYWDGDSWENALSYTTDNLGFTGPSPVFNVNSTDNTTTSSIYFLENGVLLGALLQQNLNHPVVDRQGDLEVFVDPDGNDFVIYTNGVNSGKNFEIKKTGEAIVYNTLNLESVAQDDTATKIAALNANNEVVYRDAATLGGGTVSWNDLTDIPAGFADNIDNVASEGTGDGVTTSGSYNAVTETIDFTGTEGVSYSVDVSALLDNTDDQVIDVFAFDGTNLTLSLEDDGEATKSIDLSALLDNTDTQLTQDQVQDFAGLLFGTDTESLISTSYDNTTNTLTFTVDNNLDNYDNTMSQFLKTEVDGSITNEANTGMAWDDATNTLSVTDPNGTVSAIITGYLEEITGTELVFDGWDKDASDDLVDADFATSGLMATDGAGNYSVVSEYDPSSTNEIQGLQSVTDVSGYTTNDITLNKLHADNSIAVYDSTITGANLSLGSIDLQMTTELNILGRGWVGSEIPIGGSSFVNLDIGNAQFGVFGSGNFDTGTAFRIGTAGSIPGTTADPFELDIDFTGYRGRPKARIRAINKDNDNRSSYLSFWVNEQVNNTDSFLERMRIAENGNVGIGTTSPFFKLDVNGTFRTTGTNIFGSVANDETATKIAGLNASNQLVYRDVSTLIDDADADPTNEYNTSVSWDDATNTLTVNDGGGDKSVIITGFDDSYDYMVTTVKNEVGSGFTISKGDLVGFAGAPGNSTEVFGNLFSGAQDQSYNVIGVAAEPIAEDAKGSVVTEGVLTGINTEGFVDGTLLYASTTTPGALTSDNSSHIMVAAVLQGGVANGSILIRPDYYANENDPTFSASDAASIAAADIANWNAAYGWGDHSTAGYATTTYADQAEQDAKDYADANDDNTQNTVNTANNTIPYWNTTTSSWESSNIVHGAEDITISGSTTILTQATDASRGLDVYQGYIRAQPYSDNNAAYVMNNAAGTTNLTIRPNGDNSIIRQANVNGTLDLETSNLSLSTLAENPSNDKILTYNLTDRKIGYANISTDDQTLQEVTDQGATTTNDIVMSNSAIDFSGSSDSEAQFKTATTSLTDLNSRMPTVQGWNVTTFQRTSNGTLNTPPNTLNNANTLLSFDATVGYGHQLAFLNNSNFDSYLWYRQQYNNAFGDWERILTTNDFQDLQSVTDQGATTTNVIEQRLTSADGIRQYSNTSSAIWRGPINLMRRSGGSYATPTEVLNTYTLGGYFFEGYNSGNAGYISSSAIKSYATADYTTANSNPTRLVFEINNNNGSTLYPLMTLNSNLRVGIKQSNPSFALDVNGTVGFPAISDGSSFDQILAYNSSTGEVGFTTDQTGTDDQQIFFNSETNILSIQDANFVDLSPLASGGGLTWDDQTKVSYVYSGEDLDLSTVFTGDFRNYHIVLNTENISSSRASLPTPSATYEKYLVMVTCIDPGAGGCFVDNVGVAGSTLSEFMYPGDAAFVKCVKIDNVGTYGWVMTESDAALVDVTLQTVTDNGNTTTNNIETSGSLTVGADLNLSSVNIATDLSQVGDGILTIDDGVVTRVSTSVFADQDAIEVPFTSTSTLSSTNVQDAIEELDTELRNKVDNYIVASNQVNVTISNGIMNQFTKIDLNSSASATLTVSGTPTTGGVYTFFFQNGSNTTINLPTNFSDESGNALNLTVTGGKWITCLYDNTNNNDTYYCK